MSWPLIQFYGLDYLESAFWARYLAERLGISIDPLQVGAPQ